ncbi:MULTISPECIES: sortase-associated OmpA-like protein PdsO [Pseudoalteromonas]|uniref:Sortase-associated OmpA-like protein PdsO n=1 Tax=Pseudoalteromonas fuliginea TaxID=1872678 RepID=A0ABQ6RDI7_9GAMM|nr:sortase-associated OmpA-like protein PdsO [Pseudoalteromonas fuliginea]KAA1150592.1 sortase-associated OmpA-like protein PdsO [Pseudoalteromonas fuliginea]KAA1165331.1 sortase-associated OmpA-like protein PdsO [Pseudoalteromonas fuliginea]
MKKTLIALTLVASFCTPAIASTSNTPSKETHKETAIGLGAGAIIGGVVGGPIGAFIGAFAGGLIGDSKVADNKIAEQERAITVMKEKTSDYQHVLNHNNMLEQQLEVLANQNEQLTQVQINNLLAMTVQFKTGSSVIAPHFALQLDQLVTLLNNQPQLALDLSGFADQRGDEQANLLLSKARVNAVQSYLIKHGVSHKRLSTQAFGEQQTLANSNTVEDNFFDRRVTLTTRSMNPVNGQTASN